MSNVNKNITVEAKLISPPVCVCVCVCMYIYIYIYIVLTGRLLAGVTQYSDPCAGWGTGESGFKSRLGHRVFSSPRPAVGPHTPSCSTYRRTGSKATGTRNSLISIADIKNACSCTSSPHYVFMA